MVLFDRSLASSLSPSLFLFFTYVCISSSSSFFFLLFWPRKPFASFSFFFCLSYIIYTILIHRQQSAYHLLYQTFTFSTKTARDAESESLSPSIAITSMSLSLSHVSLSYHNSLPHIPAFQSHKHTCHMQGHHTTSHINIPGPPPPPSLPPPL